MNIGPNECRKRLTGGAVVFAVGAAVAAMLILAQFNRWWRLAVFIPFYMGALGIVQAKEKTCVALAAQGLRNMDNGEERIMEPHKAEAMRTKAASVQRRSLFLSTVLTAVTLVIPD
jgi:hypothetical protein